MTVGGIGHQMAEKPVRHGLQEIRALAGADLLYGFADGVADGQHLHAIDPAGFDAVSGGVLGNVGVERDRTFDRRAHPVAVVLAEKQHGQPPEDRKSTRLNSSHLVISYAVFCLKKKKKEYKIRDNKDSDKHA